MTSERNECAAGGSGDAGQEPPFGGQIYDVSFAYYFRWDCPDQHIKEALRILLCSRSADEADESDESDTRAKDDQLSMVRWLIATNPNTPPPVLDHLTSKADPALLERIAENPMTRSNTLSKLAFHASSEVRAAVTENLNTPTEIVGMLVGDESPDVRYRLAENPHIAAGFLNELAEDENPYVAQRAQRTLLRLHAQEPVQAEFYRTDLRRRASP